MEDLERVLAGQCIHGHEHQRDCGACVMTRHLALQLRKLLEGMFGGGSAHPSS